MMSDAFTLALEAIVFFISILALALLHFRFKRKVAYMLLPIAWLAHIMIFNVFLYCNLLCGFDIINHIFGFTTMPYSFWSGIIRLQGIFTVIVLSLTIYKLRQILKC